MRKTKLTVVKGRPLFSLPPLPLDSEEALKPLETPVWTESKAKLIERYIYYFLMITRHGTYIDGFAGPQNLEHPAMWSAKLVLELKPKWLRHFYLCDLVKSQYTHLQGLKALHVDDKTRQIRIHNGDCNEWIPSILPNIKEKEATFCLLDQRTFECRWATVEAIARHKTQGTKIEIFYFLPNGWMARAFAALQNKETLRAWWGRDDCSKVPELSGQDLRNAFTVRFKELGYRSVKPWPIYEKKESSRIMYWMIHATDHAEAPRLMRRAYAKAVTPIEIPEQLKIFS